MSRLNLRIAQALGVGSDAHVEQAVTGIKEIQSDLQTAQNRAETPSLDHFVPRADYDAALNRANAAEQKLEEQQAEAKKQEIETALNQALEAGKITPATVEYHRPQCQAEGGLERFNAYVEQAPVIAGKSGLDGRQPETAHNRTENDDAAKIRRMFGHSEEDLKKVDQARN